MKTAIIDMGTNTFHLLIAEVEESGFRFLHEQREATRIGAGGINDGRITEEAIVRAMTTLRHFKNVIDQYQVTESMAFGTSAVRNAANGEEFIKVIYEVTGIRAKVISGEEEAALIYEGIKLAMDIGESSSLIMDIGGGSVEFIIGNKHGIFWKRSFEIGGQRMLEKFKPHDPILSSDIEKLNLFFNEKLSPLFEAIDNYTPKTLIGSSGSFDTFSEIYCLKNGIQYPKTPETPLTMMAFQTIHKELISKTRADRMLIPGMIELRADMIVVASCLVKYILDNHIFQNLRVSSFSLKEGILSQLISSKTKL